ncbi:HET-domain-containing protein [Diaporthe amygdali]|uniref:HET-domain-containing protein n=1 Tax=Phomopsis amygdali TaxID=1214568 RepID=UPI0022FEEA88|nr:HET-domain-containing protein [Diaporthe amygdali]KAJ0122048.1 HET-domain-containing protein [Diaporthe amygdali]
MMRLIHVHTFHLHEFVGNPSTFPNYAILSHTWEDGEVSFEDLQDVSLARQMKGFNKIKYCCEQAAEDGFEWAWVDTCCIDKTSSAELSEAINSMYNWYGNAMACYAYLSDVGSAGAFNHKTELQHIGELPRWFKRGWTLQELIAPLSVKFFTKDWRFIGTKKDKALRLSIITGIDAGVLRHERSAFQIPVAEQILKTTNDDSLFLWQMRSPHEWSTWDNTENTLDSSSMLASSPSEFDRQADCFSLQPECFFCEPQLMPRELGLRMTLPMRKMAISDVDRFQFPSLVGHIFKRVFVAALGCLVQNGEGSDSQVAILLQAVSEVGSPEKKVLRRIKYIHCLIPLLEARNWQTYTCFVAGDAPFSFAKKEKRFLNQVDLNADTTFAIENIEAPRYLDCSGYMSAAFIIQCGVTGQDYLLTYAMDTLNNAPTRAFIQFETLPARYNTLVVQNRYKLQIPQPLDWTLALREGYGPIMEDEISLEGDLMLSIVLKCEEDRSGDTYKLRVRCTRILAS